MTINGFEILFYTISFIIPGYIIRAVLERLAPLKRPDHQQSRFLQLLAYGSVNSVALFWWFGTDMLEPNKVRSSLTEAGNLFWWLGIILVLPLFIGLARAALREWETPQHVLEKMGFSVLETSPSAWDDKIHKMGEAGPVVVTLKSGGVVGGDLRGDSYAAAAKNGGDLYLEETYWLDEEGWFRFENSPGIWIDGSEIKLVEFHPLDLVDDIEGKNDE